MKRKLFFIIALTCCLVLAVGILAACNESGTSGQQTPGGEDPGTETPGDNPGGEDPGDETVSFIVTFDTQGGSALADITVENGQVIGEFTLPTKQCSRLVGFALDTAGEQMWNVLTDTVSANITLYAIWEDAHTWGEWADTTPATCTENGERTRECEVCGATESEVIPAAHIWGGWTETIAPGCETNGERSHSCEVCGKTENEAIDALGHDYSEEYTEDVAPTCENPGSESRHCTRCDATTDSREVAALGHDTSSVEWISDSEKHWKVCARCNNETEMAAHDFGTTGICVCGVIEDTPLGEFTFTSLSNNRWEVTKYIGTRSTVVIPSEYEGGAVSSIGNAAFLGCTGLTSITIPDSVTSIGERAFWGCTGLTSVTIPDSVTSIGNFAFYGCTGLTSVIIPDSVTSIGGYAFSHCNRLTSVYISDIAAWCGIDFGDSGANPLSCAPNLYLNGKLVTDLVIPDSVTSIGSSAFEGCSGLTSVTIPDSVTSIGSYAFYCCTGLTSVTIGNSATSIGIGVFAGCSGLTSITIPDSVTSIGWYAFSGCTSLTSVTIPDSVTSIGIDAFSGCTGLTSIVVEEGNPVYHSDGNCLIETASKTLVVGCKTSVIPNDGSVTSIGNEAFYDCDSLTSVTIPDSVTSIGNFAFYGCTGLTSITIPDSVMSIGSSAFSGCRGLTSVTIGNGVTSIGYRAFYGCSGLTSITIPDSVTSIGSYAFYCCTGLTSVTIGNGVITIKSSAFIGTGLTEIYYTGDVASWCGISGLSNIMSSGRALYIGGKKVEGDLVIPDSVTSIPAYAFNGCTGLTSITIPNGVTSIGDGAFNGCTGLTEINWNAIAVEDFRLYYNETVFRNAGMSGDGITVTFGAGVTSIPAYAFNGCTALTSVIMGNGVTSIGEYAFFECTGLTSITIPDSVTSIGSYAFWGCSGLTSISIPDNVTSIGYRAFYGCDDLTSVTFENTAGWYRTSSSTATSGTELSSSNLADPSTAAEWLRSTYYNYYWKRK